MSGLEPPAGVDALVRDLGDRLGVSLAVVVERETMLADGLTPAERDELEALPAMERRQWLRGRRAIERVLASLRRDRLDTATGHWSLCHAGEASVAVAHDQLDIAGLGLALELDEPLGPEAEPFFLTSHEQNALRRLPEAEQTPARNRLWSVKRALARAESAQISRDLRRYWITPVATTQGSVRRDAELMEFAARRIENSGGWLALAIRRC